MKTAMQELIEALESQGLEMFGMEEFLEKEKQQIIDAWENGYEHGACINKDKDKYHGTQYFNETFKNE